MPSERTQIISLLKSVHPFRKMTEPQVELIADRIKETTIRKNEFIFKQDVDAEHIYLIMRGQVELSRSTDDGEEDWGIMEKGDFLGYEMWKEENPHYMTAVALQDTVLLYWEWEALDELAEQIPLLQEYIQMMFRGYNMLPRTPLDWRSSKESIHFLCRTHSLFLLLHLLPVLAFGVIFIPLLLYLFIFVFPKTIFLLILCAVFCLLTAGGLFYAYEEWQNDYFVITNRRVIAQKRIVLLYESRQESPLDAVLSVSSKSPGFWARQFGYGGIVIRTYTGTIFMGRIWHPEQIISMLEERLGRVTSTREVMDKQIKVDRVRERLGMPVQGKTDVDGAPEGDSPAAKAEESSPLLKLLSKLFQLRKQNGTVITWRTHWYLLAKRIWVQSAVLIVLFLFPFIYVFSATLRSLPFVGLFLPYFIALIGFSGWWLYGYVDWGNDIYILTDDQIIDINRKPLGKEEKSTAALKNIQSIEYERIGVIGLLLNFGTVYIRIGDEQFTFDNVYDPSQVQRKIFSRLAEQKHKTQRAEVAEDQHRILDWIEAYHRATEDERPRRSDQDAP